MPRLLVISLSAGAGHVRAAEAIKKTADQKYPGATVEHIDMMDYVTAPMKRAIVDSYELMIKNVPELWGFLYKKSNTENVRARFGRLTKTLRRLNASAFYKFIEAFAPDHIIATHALPGDMITNDRKKNMPGVSLVVTDYDLHYFWIVPNVRTYFVATDKMRWKLLHHGVEAERVVISGIPIDPAFYEKPLNTDQKKPSVTAVLLLSGGQGLTHIDRLLETMFQSKKPLAIAAIAGKNNRLEHRLRAITPPGHIDLKVVGWTDRIHEYMQRADLIITKPGGITTTECIALGKPIIAIDPIPGQEEHNVQYILDHGHGVAPRSALDLLYYLETAKWQTRSRAAAPSEKTAAEIILRTVISRISGPTQSA